LERYRAQQLRFTDDALQEQTASVNGMNLPEIFEPIAYTGDVESAARAASNLCGENSL
jgi:hypothetical protein